MLSVSKNEFNIIGFLARNFSKKFTIRNIASELKVSAPGAHASLKKLEKNNIVKAEKLGTGLFYEIDYANKTAYHLAAASLLDHFELKNISIKELENEAKAALFDGKEAIIITNSPDNANAICSKMEIKCSCLSEDEFLEMLKVKDENVIHIIQKGNVLFGEEQVINLIKKVIR